MKREATSEVRRQYATHASERIIVYTLRILKKRREASTDRTEERVAAKTLY